MIDPGGGRQLLPEGRLEGQKNFSEREFLMKVIFLLAIFQMSVVLKCHNCSAICSSRSLSWIRREGVGWVKSVLRGKIPYLNGSAQALRKDASV